MKRRLAMRDRAAWLIAALAVGVVVYLVFPLWVVVTAAVLLIALPLIARRRRPRARR